MRISFEFTPITNVRDSTQCDYFGCSLLASCYIDHRAMCAGHAGLIWDKAQRERPENKAFMDNLLNNQDRAARISNGGDDAL